MSSKHSEGEGESQVEQPVLPCVPCGPGVDHHTTVKPFCVAACVVDAQIRRSRERHHGREHLNRARRPSQRHAGELGHGPDGRRDLPPCQEQGREWRTHPKFNTLLVQCECQEVQTAFLIMTEPQRAHKYPWTPSVAVKRRHGVREPTDCDRTLGRSQDVLPDLVFAQHDQARAHVHHLDAGCQSPIDALHQQLFSGERPRMNAHGFMGRQL